MNGSLVNPCMRDENWAQFVADLNVSARDALTYIVPNPPATVEYPPIGVLENALAFDMPGTVDVSM